MHLVQDDILLVSGKSPRERGESLHEVLFRLCAVRGQTTWRQDSAGGAIKMMCYGLHVAAQGMSSL